MTMIMRVCDLSSRDCRDLLGDSGLAVRMGPLVFNLRTTLPNLVEPIKLLYAHYSLESRDSFMDFEVGLLPRSSFEKWRGRDASSMIDGQPVFRSFNRALAIPMMEWAINWCVFTSPHQYLILHSAVLEHAGKAIILPGQPGAGKSTLCAGLSLRNWRLLSDEVAVMRPPDVNLIPVPRPIGLKEQSIDVIKQFEPSVVMGPSTPGTRKGTVAHVQVNALAVAKGRETAAPGLIVFPTYKPGAGVILTPFSKAQTLLRIAQDAFNFSILGSAGFETLAALVEASDCYSLTYSDMDSAIAQLTAKAEQLAGNAPPTGQAQ